MDAAASGTTLLPEIMRPSVINATSATALSLSNAVTMLAMPPAPNTQYHSLYATWLQACYMAHFRAGAYCVVTRRVCLSLTEHVCTVYNQLSVFTGYSAHEVKEVLGISACLDMELDERLTKELEYIKKNFCGKVLDVVGTDIDSDSEVYFCGDVADLYQTQFNRKFKIVKEVSSNYTSTDSLISLGVLPRCKSTEVTCWEVCSRTPDSSRVNSWQQVSATSGLPFRL